MSKNVGVVPAGTRPSKIIVHVGSARREREGNAKTVLAVRRTVAREACMMAVEVGGAVLESD